MQKAIQAFLTFSSTFSPSKFQNTPRYFTLEGSSNFSPFSEGRWISYCLATVVFKPKTAGPSAVSFPKFNFVGFRIAMP